LTVSGFAYQAVYRYLIQLINEPGSGETLRLPSLRQLADRLNVSISTIQYAYSLLEKEGRVYCVAKSGYYAKPPGQAPLPACEGDLLETIYINARRPGMRVLSADDPASIQPLDNPLLMIERELLRQYPRIPQSPAQPWGEQALRVALAARYTVSPENCWHADDVYIGADLRGVLEILIAALGLQRATVVVESPCDWVILRLLEEAHVRVIELPVQGDGSLDPLRLESLLKSETVRLVLLSSALSMPHGSLIPRANRQAIAHLLVQHGTWVLENDAYGELQEEPEGHRIRDLLDPQRLLVFSTFEKFIGAEAPYGFVLAKGLRSELQRHFLLRSFRLSPIRQKAIARLYGGGRIDQHLQILRRLLKERRSRLINVLRERLGDALHIVEPQGGSTVWLRSSRPVNMERVFRDLLRQQVLVAPGDLFSLQGLHANHVRLSSLGYSDQALAEMVGLLGDSLRLASI
jgi:DNA-binding transcriptional MocR family regulator